MVLVTFDTGLIFVLAIILIASVVRSAFGFGDALIAMPLLAFFMSMKTAVPLVALTGFTISLLILYKHWRTAYTKGLWILIVFCIIGIPAGIFFLKYADDKLVKIILATIIILFSSINLIKPNYFELKSDKSAWLFGIVSGMLGGAYNTNGPPVIIYGNLRRWEPQNFRAILQTVFLPTNLFIILCQGTAGFWSKEVVGYFLVTVPVIVAGTFIGSMLVKKLSNNNISRFIIIFLIIIGIILIVKTLLS